MSGNSAKDFFRPLAVGAPEPLREIPARPSRAIHFFDPSNEKMAAKVPDMVGTVDVLLGKRTPKVEQHGHDQLSVFGIGTELGEGEWRGVVRQLLAQGLLAVEGAYQVLALTELSRPVLAGQQQVLLRRDPVRQVRTRTRSAAAAVTLPAGAAPVFERLRAWRGATAKEQGVPAYVVFHDATLREIVKDMPNVRLAQWDAALAGTSGQLQPDGIHPSLVGSHLYAKTVRQAFAELSQAHTGRPVKLKDLPLP